MGLENRSVVLEVGAGYEGAAPGALRGMEHSVS